MNRGHKNSLPHLPLPAISFAFDFDSEQSAALETEHATQSAEARVSDLVAFMDAGVAKKLFFEIPDPPREEDACFGRGSAAFRVYSTPSVSYGIGSGQPSYKQQGSTVDVAVFATAQQSLPVRYGIPEGQLHISPDTRSWKLLTFSHSQLSGSIGTC